MKKFRIVNRFCSVKSADWVKWILLGISFVLSAGVGIMILNHQKYELKTTELTIKKYTGIYIKEEMEKEISEEDIENQLGMIRHELAEYKGIDEKSIAFSPAEVEELTEGKCKNREELQKMIAESQKSMNQYEALLKRREKILECVLAATVISHYENQRLEEIKRYVEDSYQETAKVWDLSLEEFKKLSLNCTSAREYEKLLEQKAKEVLKVQMVVDAIVTKEKLFATGDEYEEQIRVLMQMYAVDSKRKVLDHISKEEIIRTIEEDKFYDFLEENSIS